MLAKTCFRYLELPLKYLKDSIKSVLSVISLITEESGDIVSQMITSAMTWCDGYVEPLLVPLNAWLQPPLPLQIKSIIDYYYYPPHAFFFLNFNKPNCNFRS